MADILSPETSSDHFDINYNSTENKWQSSRTFNTLGCLKPWSPFQQYVIGQSSYIYGKHGAANARREAAEKLTRARPEVMPGIEAAVENLDESSRFLGIPEPLLGDVIALGVIEHRDIAQNPDSTLRQRRRTVLAFPTGTSADTVSIFQLNVKDLTCGQHPQASIETLDMDAPLTTTWSVKGASIRQLLFSANSKVSFSLLAIRTATTAHVLRLVVSGGELHVEATLAVPFSHSFKSECVNLSFSPDKIGMLAAAGSAGELLIWRITQRLNNIMTCTIHGSRLMSFRRSDFSNADHLVKDDGWRTIRWMPGKDMLLICDRYHLECWNTAQLEFITAHSKPASEGLPVVDVQVCDSLHSTLVLLTTGRVALLQLNVGENEAAFEELFSWDHGRDHSDLRLQMALIQHEDDTHMTLSSRQNDLITMLSFNHSTARRVVRRDQFRIPGQGSAILSLIHHPCPLVQRRTKVTRTITRPDQTFYSQMFSLGLDLSLCECICYARPILDDAGGEVMEDFNTVSSSIPDLVVGHPATQEAAIVGMNHGNKIQEGYESGVDTPFTMVNWRHGALERYSRRFLPDLQALYSVPRQRVVTAMISSWQHNLEQDKETLDGLCGKILGHNPNQAKSLASLTAYASGLILTEESNSSVSLTEQVAGRLREQDHSISGQWRVLPLAASEPLGLAEFGVDMADLRIDAVYRQLLLAYNRPLTSAARGNQRLLKEAVVRRAASVLSLAAVGVIFDSTRGEDEGEGSTAPSASSALHEGSHRVWNSSQLQQSQQMPSSMGVEMSSSAETMLKDTDDPVDKSIARLRKFTQISVSSADSTKLLEASANGLSEVLAHWDESLDPSQYSYEGTNAMLAGETLIYGSAMSTANREKAARREMKARQRQVARQARSEAAATKQDLQEPLESNTKASRQRVNKKATDSGAGFAGSQRHRSIEPSHSQRDAENMSRYAARQTTRTTTTEEVIHRGLTGQQRQPSEPRPQGDSSSSSLFTPQPRLPERGKRPPKKRGF